MIDFDPQIMTEPERKLEGLEYVGRAGGAEIPARWQAFMPPMHEVPRIMDAFGPSLLADNGDPEPITYLARPGSADFSVITKGMNDWDGNRGFRKHYPKNYPGQEESVLRFPVEARS